MKKNLLGKIAGALLGTCLLTSVVVVSINKTTLLNISPLKAEGYSITLDNSNSPVLSTGDGSMVDSKGVTWEYSNASDYNSGHISLNNEGYFGVSSITNWAYTGINGIVANFNSDNELWLLKSIDGVTWSESEILTSGLETHSADNWRYIRFYNWSDNNTSINIDSIVFHYSCSGVSSTEDVDGAKTSNVISTSSNLNYASEYNDLSPNSVGGEAVSFTKVNNASTWINIGFGETYKVGDVQNAKVEFDMKTSNINYGKYIQLMKDNETLGSVIYSDKSSAYKCTNISGDWYHIELPITTVISTISGIVVNGEIKDKPHTEVLKKEFNGIKINAGTCIIDNLRVTSGQCSLGIFNNPTYKPSVNEFFWLKVAWVGKLYPEQVTITFDDDTLARHIPVTDENLLYGSPFYIQLLGTGTVTATCTVVSGYNRESHIIQHTIVVK